MKADEVFLSFRGEDTRESFTRNLFNALNTAKVRTFFDEKLKIGENIGEFLESSIKQSKVSVIVLSKNFANSSWCLKELHLIVERQAKHGHVILPVFYHVQRSDLSEKFDGEEKENSREEEDLKIVAGIEGLDSREFESDSELIKAIVKGVKRKLRRLKVEKWALRAVKVGAIAAPFILL